MDVEFFYDIPVKDSVLTKYIDFLSQVSFRLELTTPACPIKDMVNDTVIIV